MVHTVEVLAGRKKAVEVEEFVSVVAQVLEEHTLGMAQVEEVKSLGQGVEHNLAVVVVGQHQPKVLGDEQTAGFGFGKREKSF